MADSETRRRNERRPYVGEGAIGIRKSIDMDREQLDTMDGDDPGRAAIEDSIDLWHEQLEAME